MRIRPRPTNLDKARAVLRQIGFQDREFDPSLVSLERIAQLMDRRDALRRAGYYGAMLLDQTLNA